MTPQLAMRWQLLALTVVIAGVIWALAPMLTPFAVAAMFAYLFDPLADRLERLKLSRGAARQLTGVEGDSSWICAACESSADRSRIAIHCANAHGVPLVFDHRPMIPSEENDRRA